ncbi:MAG TPA: zf-HC2 domain-containing protein [Anaeromyxobacteraceae bacterium]|nr:zf-HC2 domain-containing protein [Anaeromyxobacteraceae bacterium]
MDCTEARELLHDLRRRRLDAARAEAVVGHLQGCSACRREDESEALLDRLLLERLPRPAAPAPLRGRLAALAAGAPVPVPPVRRTRRWPRLLAPALAAGVLVAGSALVLQRRGAEEGALSRLAGEAVSDHLRLLASAHPYEVESSITHQVKPWFAGKLDIAPAVPGDVGDLRLQGGAVGYFLDRKAAVVSYALRRHRVTLLAFPAAGLAWPEADRSAGGVPARATSLRGFDVVLWRQGELGYALVSDAEDLGAVAAQVAPATAQ